MAISISVPMIVFETETNRGEAPFAFNTETVTLFDVYSVIQCYIRYTTI